MTKFVPLDTTKDMAAHHELIHISSNLRTWQKIWQYMVAHDFMIFPNEESVQASINEVDKALVIQPESFLLEKLSGLKEGLKTPLLLRNFLTSDGKMQTRMNYVFEWNYLGPNKEKAGYLEYLEQFFWRNQDNLTLSLLPEFTEIVANPWKISAYLNELEDLTPKPPSDFFSDKTVELVDSLGQMFKQWDFNPFLIYTDRASLQWQIKDQHKFSLVGYLFQVNGELWQRVEFIDLTTTELLP